MAGNVAGSESQNNGKVNGNGATPKSETCPNCQNGCPRGMPMSIPNEKTVDPGKLLENGCVVKEMEKFTVVDEKTQAKQKAAVPTWQAVFTLFVLLLANTLNYMDRYTIAGGSLVCYATLCSLYHAIDKLWPDRNVPRGAGTVTSSPLSLSLSYL